jgi:hypothetical protein
LNKTDLAAVITGRLEDMATQVEFLYANGLHEEAAILREEGLMIAEAYDREETFFFLGSAFAN